MKALRGMVLVLAAGCAGSGKTGAEGGLAFADSEAGLRGAWIGLAADGLTYYRLVLGEEGTGLCATAAGKEERLYRVRHWSVAAKNRLTVHLELVGGGSLARAKPLLTLSGAGRPARLDLTAQGLHSLSLWREGEFLAAAERLKRRCTLASGG